MLNKEQKQFFDAEGYLIVEGLFSQDEIEFYKHHFEAMRIEQKINNPTMGDDAIDSSDDPLIAYPRIMQPHRQDEASLKWLIDSRLNVVMTDLLGQSPYAVQTMFYFKPPQARGQALHQDQYYLRAQPGTCIAAWMAVDDCDVDNGCLRVVPGTQTMPILCLTESDTSVSFTDVTVEIPNEDMVVPAVMKAGDVLFFNGQLIHGSLPNTTSDRFRRALIGHYIVGEAEKVYKYYHPVLRMDGTEIGLGISEQGGMCGTWISAEGEHQLTLQPEKIQDR
jgi:phytanoyl-CoA hydroxylase